MNVKEIVQKYLQENGYDGLCDEWHECGCQINDLMPCGEYCGDCIPGYKIPDPDYKGHWLITKDKPE